MEFNNSQELEGEVNLHVLKRSAIKLADCPHIAICMPIGAKENATLFETPDGQKWMQPGVQASGLVPIQWVLTNQQWVPPLNVSISYMCQWNMLSAKARQLMTMAVVRELPNCKYIFYVDDDVLVPALGLYILYNFMEQHPEAGAISGVYVTRQDPCEPVVYKDHGKGAFWDFKIGDAPVEVMGFGAGCVLARTDAIRKVLELNTPDTPIWADEIAIPEDQFELANIKVTWGHDIRFCKLLQEAGYKVYLDPRVECGHWDIAAQKEYRLPADSPPKRKEEIKNDAT